jgi:hypothetical protein
MCRNGSQRERVLGLVAEKLGISAPRYKPQTYGHGYVRVYVESFDAAYAAVEACERAALEIDGFSLTISLSAGRADSLFPRLPYRVRYQGVGRVLSGCC